MQSAHEAAHIVMQRVNLLLVKPIAAAKAPLFVVQSNQAHMPPSTTCPIITVPLLLTWHMARLQVKQTVGLDKKVLKIFLVDRAGGKHLAAIGDDLGDAHYAYRSTKPFTKYGRLECHNRNELHIWCVKHAAATAAAAACGIPVRQQQTLCAAGSTWWLGADSSCCCSAGSHLQQQGTSVPACPPGLVTGLLHAGQWLQLQLLSVC